MKHFVQYVDTTAEGDSREAVRILEINDVPQQNQRARSLMGMAATEACKQCVLKMSRLAGDYTFSWGHEEADGRTFLHGFALNGTYRDESGREVNTRKVEVRYVDGRTETLRSSRDAFEFDLTGAEWKDASSMMFFANGVEAASIYLKNEENDHGLNSTMSRFEGYAERLERKEKEHGND